MGTNPEHLPEADAPQNDAVTWIGRDRPPFERAPDPHAARPPGGPTSLTADADGARRKWMIRGVALAVVLAAVAIALWVSHRSKPALTALADKTQAPLISVMTPALKAVTSNVTFSGGIAARYDMPIGNDGDTGRVVAVYVEAGDHVRRGQILAKLDDSVLIPQVNRLAASLEQARAQAELSQAEYKRALGVAAAGALSAEDIEKRRATAVTDAANVKVAAAQLAEGEARLKRTRISAPIDGVVLTRKAEVGQIANPGGEALFRVASGGEVEMRGQLAEQDLAQVKVGDAGHGVSDRPAARVLRARAPPGRDHRSADPPGGDPHRPHAGSGAAARRLRARLGDHRQGAAAGRAADRRAGGHRRHLRLHRQPSGQGRATHGARRGHER